MNMKKAIFAMGAALAAVVGASPASATIYQYTTRSGAVLSINTVTKSGTLSGLSTSLGINSSILTPTFNAFSLSFTSNDFANFTGGENPNFGAFFLTVSGTSSLWGNVIPTVGGNTPGMQLLAGAPGRALLNSVNFQNFDGSNTSLNFGALSNFTIVPEPNNVPEPAMLGLFGAGAVMVMMGRRRRSVGKVQGSARLATV